MTCRCGKCRCKQNKGQGSKCVKAPECKKNTAQCAIQRFEGVAVNKSKFEATLSSKTRQPRGIEINPTRKTLAF